MRLEFDTTVSAPPIAQETDLAGSVDSAEVKSALNQGIKAAQAGNRAHARNFLLRATELDPRNENAWLWLASISEYPEELLGFLNHVLEINPENQRATEWKVATHSLLSKTFVQRGIDASQESQKVFAAECFQTALEYDDRNAVAWMWMAFLSDSNDDKVLLLEKALAIEPGNESAANALEAARASILKERLTLAKSAAIAGHHYDAINILDSLLDVKPDSIEAWTMKSHLSDSFDEKIRCFESILAIDPENVAAKVSRDSLLSIFGTAEAAYAESSKEPDEDNDAAPGIFASYAIEPAIDKSPTQDLEMPVGFATVIDHTFETETKNTPEEEYENEQRESVAEPFAALTEEATEPVEAPASPWNELAGGIAVSDHIVESPSEDVFEPFATLADETTQPVEAPGSSWDELAAGIAANGHVHESTPEEDSVSSSVDSDPHAETVAFSYDVPPDTLLPDSYEGALQVDNWSGGASAPLMMMPVEDSDLYGEASDPAIMMPAEDGGWSTEASEPPIMMPMEDLPLEENHTESAVKTFVEATEVLKVKAESIECPFCGGTNDPQVISCQYCFAVLTLSDLELLLANQNTDKQTVRRSVEEMERQRQTREFGPDELTTLGLGHLNLRNLQLGYACLHEASKLNPNNVVLGGQVNSLLIRLDEIKKQEEAHLKMPKGKSILVVDDSPTVRKLIADKLEKCGHDVICANDGVEALERLENYVPDLVLLDITMPRMDGYQVCKHIRSNNSTKDVTVVMISGKDGFFDKVRGRMAGTTGYITKPFGPETLMKAVEMYLSGEAPELDEV